MSAELMLTYVKTIGFFYKFYDFFCRRLMNQPCYSNLFQIMQHGSFQILNRVILFSENMYSPELMSFDTVLK